MKQPVRRLTDNDLRAYPIADLVEGWFFQMVEVSNGVWRVEGKDHWGRTVTRHGTDPDALLRECKQDAEGLFRERN